jgi:hypothetical protein
VLPGGAARGAQLELIVTLAERRDGCVQLTRDLVEALALAQQRLQVHARAVRELLEAREPPRDPVQRPARCDEGRESAREAAEGCDREQHRCVEHPGQAASIDGTSDVSSALMRRTPPVQSRRPRAQPRERLAVESGTRATR